MKTRAKTCPPLNLQIDPASAERLSEQLANAIKCAIRNHLLRPGDCLPPIALLAKECRTSVRVPREAIAILAGEGIVTARRGIGTIVLDKRNYATRNKRILLVHPNGHGAYYLGVLMEEVDRLITEDGYAVSRIAMRKREDGSYSFEPLNHLLINNDFSAALVFAYDDKTITPIAASGLPYVVCTFRPVKYEGACGRIDYTHRSALPQFIRH